MDQVGRSITVEPFGTLQEGQGSGGHEIQCPSMALNRGLWNYSGLKFPALAEGFEQLGSSTASVVYRGGKTGFGMRLPKKQALWGST